MILADLLLFELFAADWLGLLGGFSSRVVNILMAYRTPTLAPIRYSRYLKNEGEDYSGFVTMISFSS